LSNPIAIAPNEITARASAGGRTSKCMLALGMVALACGALGLVVLLTLTVIDVWYVGLLLLLVAVVQVAVIPGCRGWKGIYWQSVAAAVYILGGAAILTDPLLESAYAGAAVAGLLLVAGFARSIIARQMQPRRGWSGVMLAGLIALLLGLIAAAEGPLANPFGVALLVSLEMLLLGASCLLIAANARAETRATKA